MTSHNKKIRVNSTRNRTRRMSSNKVSFGSHTLDLKDGLLFKDGERVNVRPQAMRVLVQLVTNRGELVSRRELTRGLWADSRIDEHQGLNAIIRHLRSAFGDDPNKPRYIETIPTKGYRFIAECRDAAGRARFRVPDVGLTRRWVSAVAAAVVIGAVGLVSVLQTERQQKSIFDDLPPDAVAAYQEGMQQYRQGGILNSRHSFQKVVELAPSFAEGQMMLGRSFVSSQYANLALAERAEPYLREAIRLKPDLAGAYIALARIAMIKNLDANEATDLVEKALSLEPENVEALGTMSTIRVAQGDTFGAIDYQMQMEKIDPTPTHRHCMRGYIFLWGGEYEAAARECREALRLMPGVSEPTFCLFEAYLAMGSTELARWQAADFVRIYGATDKELQFMQSANANEAIEWFLRWRLDMAKARTRAGGDPYSLILAHWRLGQHDEAIALVQQFIRTRHFLSIVRLGSDARLKTIMADPRLQDSTTLYAQAGG